MIDTTKLNVASVSEIMTNNAVFCSPSVSSSSSSYSIRSRSSLISNGANLAPQLISMDLAVFPQPACISYTAVLQSGSGSLLPAPQTANLRHFEILIVLSGFACINQINQHGEILLLLRSFIPDISDQCRIIELFSLDPEVLTGLLSLSFGVDYDRVYKFQNILSLRK